MKKLLAVLLALVMLVSLAACAGNTDKDNPSSDAPANSDNPSMKANVNKKIAMIMQQGGLGDQGFNDTAYTQPAIDAIRASGTPLALSMRKDPNALPHEKLAQLLELSTVIFANETETAFLCEEFGLKEIRDLFQNEKLQILVETLGAEGSRVYYRDGGQICQTQARAVRPLCAEPETVGAGDGYVCGFLYGLVHGRSVHECALLGGTLSSFVLEKEGSITNLPTEAQLLARYETIRRDD